MEKGVLIPNLFKTEYRKIVSVLCKLFGLVHIEIAEDITNDTFLLASETWGQKGIPENPKAWLYAVAKNKTKDYLKRNQNFINNITPEIKKASLNFDELDIDLSEKNINDSQLQMIFTICNNVISSNAQIGLALRILCGFGIEEIAEAFLTNKETINKRLFRAKEKLRAEHIKIEFPNKKEIDKRLKNVLTTIYLLFNEGYYSSTNNQPLKKDLCVEAMRLSYLLLQHKKTDLPVTNALLSLICFHSSRFESRLNNNGEYLLYFDQDKRNWNKELIIKGEHYLNKSAIGNEITKYHLEARIAFWHTRENETIEKWENILQLYNRLLQIQYSPIIALNRTYALSKASGKKIAIQEALKINLKQNHFYHSLMAELYSGIDKDKQIEHLNQALNLTQNKTNKEILNKKLKKVNRV
ncbi:MAG: sigma-70 family RNA polymerase sigma factor [Cellulophaga sp.]